MGHARSAVGAASSSLYETISPGLLSSAGPPQASNTFQLDTAADSTTSAIATELKTRQPKLIDESWLAPVVPNRYPPVAPSIA